METLVRVVIEFMGEDRDTIDELCAEAEQELGEAAEDVANLFDVSVNVEVRGC